MVILSVYTILLAKISGQEDLVVGSPIAARRYADLERIIGMFVNTLALRHWPTGSKTFQEFLIEVKNHTLEAYENQEYPFEELVENLAPVRDTSRNPIFDVVFNLLNEAEYHKNREVPDIAADQSSRHRSSAGTTKFDLILTASEIGNNLIFNLEYCTRLFKPGTIARFIRYFKKIVSTLVENPAVTLAGIEIISAEEKKQVSYDFNQKAAGYPKDKTLDGLFVEQVTRTPDSLAAAGVSPGAGERHLSMSSTGNLQITYAALDEQSGRLAHELRRQGIDTNCLSGNDSRGIGNFEIRRRLCTAKPQGAPGQEPVSPG